MKRIQIDPIISGYKLSHLASELVFIKPSLRYPCRPDKAKKAVLRALCDRYPNAWASVDDIAAKASCGTTQARRALRELEHKDRLIIDISTDKGKRGGRGAGCTVQYFVRDRKIMDIIGQQTMWKMQDRETGTQRCEAKTQRCEAAKTQRCEPNYTETQRSESQNPTPRVAFSSKPNSGSCRTDKVLTDKINRQEEEGAKEEVLSSDIQEQTPEQEMRVDEVRGFEQRAEVVAPAPQLKTPGVPGVVLRNAGPKENRSKQLVELVKQAVLSTTSSACVYAKHWQAIEGQIAGSDWTAEELKRAAAECVEDRDAFALSHAGDFLCNELGARIANMRNTRADGYPILTAPD